MKHWIPSSVLISVATLAPATPIAGAQGGQACERSNLMLREASQRRAQADFCHRLAACLADPSCDPGKSLVEAAKVWREQHALSEQVFQARSQACALFGHERYRPQIEPSQFCATISNPFLPLPPGRVLVYQRQTAEGLERVRTSVSAETVEIGGVVCREMIEHETLGGALVEHTRNWVAQHQSGAVWYFGEVTLEYSEGMVESIDGSWRFGTDGAQPGVLMPFDPVVGQTYRQEFLLGEAEDLARIVRLNATVQVPAGSFEHCVVTEDWDPLEPLEYILKFFAPNIGLVLEIDTRTGERLELVEIAP